MEYSGGSTTQDLGERIGNALRAIYPRSTAKLAARDAHASQRTVEKWLDGTSSPSLVHFAYLIAKHPSLFLVLGPIVTWAPVAVPAVEEALMQSALDQMPAKRRAAIAAMGARL